MKKNFINYCGLLGIVAFLSYTAAVVSDETGKITNLGE